MKLTDSTGVMPSGIDERRQEALRVVDAMLYRRAQGLLGTLRMNHPARLGAWRMPLRNTGNGLVRYTPEEFARLDRMAQFAEVVRAEAEALLVHEQLGYILLNDGERDDRLLRALGILPADEGLRFAEITNLHDVSPKHILVDPAHFLNSIRSIEGCYGMGCALAYGLLIVVGVRSRDEMIKYGTMLQTVFDRVTLSPPVSRSLAQIGSTHIRQASFDTQFAVLTQVHEQLFATRLSSGREFRLNRIVEAALNQGNGEGPGPLGWTALDAVVLAKLLFPVRLQVVDRGFCLEIPLGARSVYWEPAHRAPLSHIPVQSGTRVEVFELFARTYQEIGVWNSLQGQITRAVQAFRQALALKKDSPETWHQLGQVHLRGNQPNEAIEACRQAVALDPNLAEAYVTLGNALITRNCPDEAVEVLKTAIRLKPTLAEAFNNLGFAYQQQNELDRAIVAFQTATRLRPGYAQAHYNLGNVYLAANKVKLSIAAYQRTVKVNPSFVRAWYNLGLAYYQDGRLDDAIESYKTVLRINPKHAGALYNLGIAYRDKGMKEKAVEALEAAVKLNPNLLR